MWKFPRNVNQSAVLAIKHGIMLVSYCHLKNCPKTSCICYNGFGGPAGTLIQLNWIPFFSTILGGHLGCHPGPESHSKDPLGRDPLSIHSTTVGRIQWVTNYWLEATLVFLSSGLPQLRSSKHRRQRRDSSSRTEVTIFYNLIIKVAPHHLCLTYWNLGY
jgi:hypothetical protein